MEKVNLLDLNNDVLNIIGDYVKKDNIDRITTDYNKRQDEKTKKIIFKYVSSQLKEIKKICKDKLMIINLLICMLANVEFSKIIHTLKNI